MWFALHGGEQDERVHTTASKSNVVHIDSPSVSTIQPPFNSRGDLKPNQNRVLRDARQQLLIPRTYLFVLFI